MLMRTDPFREFDRLTRRLNGSAAQPAAVPMDAYRTDDTFVAQFDLPGVDPQTVDLDIERNVLTVRAERRRPVGDDVELVVGERPTGTFSRQLFLSDALNADRTEAHYDNGVLTVRIPVAEQAKPRKVAISGGGSPGRRQLDG